MNSTICGTRTKIQIFKSNGSFLDLSTFDYNSIQNTTILEGAFENSLTSKLLLVTKIWPNNSNIATELVLP